MPRIKRMRKVLNVPIMKGFKPFGVGVNEDEIHTVNMLLEEYEALRLCDFDLYTHHQASMIMHVSRPTFTRIYESARRKLADAFVNCKAITIEGGKVYFDNTWYFCNNCQCDFNEPGIDSAKIHCPLCGTFRVKRHRTGEPGDGFANTDKKYICAVCGYRKQAIEENDCRFTVCPECGVGEMIVNVVN